MTRLALPVSPCTSLAEAGHNIDRLDGLLVALTAERGACLGQAALPPPPPQPT